MAPLQPTTHRTTCCYCGVGCGILVEISKGNTISVKGDPDHPVNRGMLCSKGQSLHTTVMDRSDRLLFPQIRDRRSEAWRRVSWDTAIEHVANRIRTTAKEFGPDAVGFYVSGQCLTEEYYLANKIAKGYLGTNNIDTNSRLCMSSAVAGYRLALGEDCVPGSYEDLDTADLFFVAGANPAYCHPILFRRMEGRLQGPAKSARMIVTDPRRTQTAALADLHIPLQPGTDITLLHAIARRLIEMEAVDHAFIAQHTEGYDELKKRVFGRSLAQAAEICRIDAGMIETAARWIAESHGFVSLWAMGLNQSVVGVNKNLALLNLHLLTGKIGQPGNGPFSLTGQPNAMGGREVGGMANLMSAHRDLTNQLHRAEIARFWGVDAVPEKPGLTAGEMMDALLDGRLKALWIICTNPMVSWPDLQKAERALGNAQFLVVQDISSRADTLRFADVVLPAAGWLEKAGTMTNSERRISYLPEVVAAPGEALADSEILLRFARAMGWSRAFDYSGPDAVYAEHAALTRGTSIDISGLDHARLQREGTLQWPVPSPGHPGTPRLFSDHHFYRPNRRAKLHGVPDDNTSPPPSAEFPLVLTTGRIRDQWHTMTRSGKVGRLRTHEPQARLDLHSDDARVRAIADNDLVEIRSATGTARLRARISDDVKPGVVFMPMHWGRMLDRDDVRANNLTHARWDPISKEPDLKFSTVEVTRWQAAKRRILIVGAGAAALGFSRAYRRDNPDDDIVVFSKEAFPFYDRVRLPEVVQEECEWKALGLLDDDEFGSLRIKVRRKCAVTEIDRDGRRVLDSDGDWHPYDTLVLATGSRAAWPKDTPKDQRGLHALRSYSDAQDIIASVKIGRPIVIVGGGLVGIEVGAVLCAKGLEVHIVQRSAHLMNKQLDEVAAGILRDELEDRGIHFHFQDQVLMWKGDEWIEELTLASGTTLRDVTVIYAMGTVPNVELAGACGLEVNRGVVVDANLRTSDPDILAVGEIAEYDGQLWGTTSAAEEQAAIAAAALAGDVQAIYAGSVSQNLLKVSGLSVVSIGMARPPADDMSYEEIVFLDRAARIYKKCVVRQDRLVGALLVGDKSDYAQLRDLIRSGEELGSRRGTLFRGSTGLGVRLGGRLVCSCMTVDEGRIRKAVTDGARSLADVMKHTTAGSGCGSCRPEIGGLLRQAAAAQNGAVS